MDPGAEAFLAAVGSGSVDTAAWLMARGEPGSQRAGAFAAALDAAAHNGDATMASWLLQEAAAGWATGVPGSAGNGQVHGNASPVPGSYTVRRLIELWPECGRGRGAAGPQGQATADGGLCAAVRVALQCGCSGAAVAAVRRGDVAVLELLEGALGGRLRFDGGDFAGGGRYEDVFEEVVTVGAGKLEDRILMAAVQSGCVAALRWLAARGYVADRGHQGGGAGARPFGDVL